MNDDYHYSFNEWLELCDKYYHDKPPIDDGDCRLIVPNKEDNACIDLSRKKTTTGIYYVYIIENHKWRYVYYKNGKIERSISRNDLRILERDVKDANMPWIIVDEDKAKRSYELSAKQNEHFNLPIVKLFD